MESILYGWNHADSQKGGVSDCSHRSRKLLVAGTGKFPFLNYLNISGYTVTTL